MFAYPADIFFGGEHLTWNCDGQGTLINDNQCVFIFVTTWGSKGEYFHGVHEGLRELELNTNHPTSHRKNCCARSQDQLFLPRKSACEAELSCWILDRF